MKETKLSYDARKEIYELKKRIHEQTKRFKPTSDKIKSLSEEVHKLEERFCGLGKYFYRNRVERLCKQIKHQHELEYPIWASLWNEMFPNEKISLKIPKGEEIF